jgi:hypothetical protein
VPLPGVVPDRGQPPGLASYVVGDRLHRVAYLRQLLREPAQSGGVDLDADPRADSHG